MAHQQTEKKWYVMYDSVQWWMKGYKFNVGYKSPQYPQARRLLLSKFFHIKLGSWHCYKEDRFIPVEFSKYHSCSYSLSSLRWPLYLTLFVERSYRSRSNTANILELCFSSFFATIGNIIKDNFKTAFYKVSP